MQRLIESERVAQIAQVFGASILAEHLLHGIAGHDVHEQENHCENQPDCGQAQCRGGRNTRRVMRACRSANGLRSHFFGGTPEGRLGQTATLQYP